MSALQVVEVDPGADPRWDAYVAAHPGGLVFHHSGWLRALQAEAARPAVDLAVLDAAGAVRGVLPLVATRGVPFARRGSVAGPRLSSLPRTPLAGPLADDDEALGLLVHAALARVPDGSDLQLKPADRRLDACAPPLHGTPWRTSYVLTLPEGGQPPSLRGDADAGTARRRGVEVRPAADRADLRAWHRLYLQTMRHHLVPARPLRFFEALWDGLRPAGMMRLLVAERDGEPVAGTIVLMLGHTTFYAFNASRGDALTHRPNDLLQQHAIRDACAEGRRFYDLGEVDDPKAGLSRFKRKWGGRPVVLHRYGDRPPAAGEATEGGAGRLREAAEGAWRRVPLRATAAAGGLVQRFL